MWLEGCVSHSANLSLYSFSIVGSLVRALTHRKFFWITLSTLLLRLDIKYSMLCAEEARVRG